MINKRIFGTVHKVGGIELLEVCPLCGDELTFRFIGNSGLWECPSCGKYGDWDDLKNGLLDRFPEIWEGRAEQMGTPEPPAGLVVLSQYVLQNNQDKRIPTGFDALDKLTDGLSIGALTVVTGKRGSGKSTFASQIALNAVNAGFSTCFYSGELSTKMFQEWMFAQAAGPNHLAQFDGENQRACYRASGAAEKKIRAWMSERLILYDNEIIKADEQNTILDRFKEARTRYGCSLFFIDNLMSARMPASQERDYYRQQSNFVRDLVVFAKTYHSHVVLMAHPRKASAGDPNDNVAGTADITNLATNVLKVTRVESQMREKYNLLIGCGTVVSLTKNREYGDLADLQFSYDAPSRRFYHLNGNQIVNYGWEY